MRNISAGALAALTLLCGPAVLAADATKAASDQSAVQKAPAQKAAAQKAPAQKATAQKAAAEKAVSQKDIQQLLDVVARQNKQLEKQQRLLTNQGKRLGSLEKQIRGGGNPGQAKRAVYRPPGKTGTTNGTRKAAEQQGQQPVGQEPKKKSSREVAIVEAGGVLTPPGTLVFEPSFEYSQSNQNRFFFSGLEVVDTVLIGQIEATDTDRDTYVGKTTFRTGITKRSEFEVKVPIVGRQDSVTNNIVSTTTPVRRNLSGSGLGDVEFTGRYQINAGTQDWPVFIASARGKTNTGKGPFDVSRDANGIETELATGSGFWGVEPAVTMLYGSDPAVFFANFKYLFHLSKDVDKTIGGNFVGNVDPGDVFGVGFGMGIGLNEKTSLSLGYEHNFVGQTTTNTNGIDVNSRTFDVGSLNVGFSHALSKRVSLNATVQVGVTEDAPDVVMGIRVPIKFQVFDTGPKQEAKKK